MTKKEAIKYLKQLYPNGGGTWLDEQRIEAVNMAITALEESAGADLDEAARQYAKYTAAPPSDVAYHFVTGVQWKEEQIMKDATSAVIGYFNQRWLSIMLDKPLERLGFSEGDKVKVIIVKKRVAQKAGQ